MTWFALMSAIAVGMVAGRELADWLGYLTFPLRARFELMQQEKLNPGILDGLDDA